MTFHALGWEGSLILRAFAPPFPELDVGEGRTPNPGMGKRTPESFSYAALIVGSERRPATPREDRFWDPKE